MLDSGLKLLDFRIVEVILRLWLMTLEDSPIKFSDFGSSDASLLSMRSSGDKEPSSASGSQNPQNFVTLGGTGGDVLGGVVDLFL